MKPQFDLSGPGVRHKLQIHFDLHECELADEDQARLADACDTLARRVGNFPQADLRAHIEWNRRSHQFLAKLTLILPTGTLVTSDHNPELRQAFGHALDSLELIAKEHLQKLERIDLRQEREETETPPLDENALTAAALAADYVAFRTAIAPYEEWLRLRAGRWIERYPEAQTKLKRDFDVLDVMEGIFLSAFENSRHRQAEVPFHAWLEGLIDPTVKAFLRDPYHERENVEMARAACAAEAR